MPVSETIRGLMSEGDYNHYQFIKNADGYRGGEELPRGTVVEVVLMTPELIKIKVLRCPGDRAQVGKVFNLIDTPSWRKKLWPIGSS